MIRKVTDPLQDLWNDEQRMTWELWFAQRPDEIKAMAEEFPFGTRFEIDGAMIVGGKLLGTQTIYMVGWADGDRLILSEVNPAVDYEGAIYSKWYACAQHFRDALKEEGE